MRADRPFMWISVGSLWAWLGFFALIPGLMVAVASFLTRGEADFVTLPLTVTNYTRLLDPIYLDVLWSSTRLATLTTLLCLALGYPFAYQLARSRSRFKRLLLLFVIIPFWTSSLVRTYAIIILLKTKGVLNSFLQWTGLIRDPLNLLYTDAAVLIGLVYSLLPFMVLPLFASIEKLDPRLLEAARDLGAGRLRRFLRIVLPLTLPGIVAGSMLVFLPALGMFYIPDLLGGAKTLLVGNLIKNQFLSARDWPFGSAVSVTLTMLMAALLLVYGWAVRKAKRKLL